jgi:hypothetical protein
MATSNFHNVNASHIFAVDLQDTYEYDDLIDNVKSGLKSTGYFNVLTKSDPNELRSYPSTSIGSLDNYVESSDGESGIVVTITAVIRSGYYDGVNLDWHCHFEEYGENIEHLLPAAEAEKNRLVEMVEYVFGEYTTPLGVTAQFSNGETIYHPVNYQS